MTDIRLKCGFHDHPKTVKLIRKIGFEGVFSLTKLWCWAAENRPKGDLSGLDVDDIEIAAGWNGEQGKFLSAIKSGWLNEDMILNSWEEEQGFIFHSDERREKARNAAASRWNKRKPSDATSMLPAYKNDATSMPHAFRNDAPSPTPSPTPSPKPTPDESLRSEVLALMKAIKFLNGRSEQADTDRENLLQSFEKVFNLAEIHAEIHLGALQFPDKDSLEKHMREAAKKKKNPQKTSINDDDMYEWKSKLGKQNV